jgi:purine-nucleoside phosphorylase
MDAAIVNPRKGKRAPVLGPLVIIAATREDLKMLLTRIAGKEGSPAFRRLFMSRLYPNCDPNGKISLAGPMLGASYGAALLESLISWGGSRFLFLGWCGAISYQVAIGDLILPSAAFVDEGTSRHYAAPYVSTLRPCRNLFKRAEALMEKEEIAFTPGAVWTTDAIFRETKRKIRYYRNKGALAVEMELSALLAVAAFRKVALASLMVVSDELTTGKWRPGSGNLNFEEGRSAAVNAIARIGLKI